MADQSRRRFLSAAGTMIALPAFESLGLVRRVVSAAECLRSRPKRVIFLGFGYGVTNETWFPDVKQTGTGYTLPERLETARTSQVGFHDHSGNDESI